MKLHISNSLLSLLIGITVFSRSANSEIVGDISNDFEKAGNLDLTKEVTLLAKVGILDGSKARNLDFTQEVTFLAKDGILDGSKIDSNNDGYTGNGFIDFGGVGSSASWLVDIPTTGFYEVTVRYASKSDRGPMDLLLDNIKIGNFEIKKVANNWSTWNEETIKVRIDAGSNRIMKILASVIQGPNVDKMTIKLLSPTTPDEPVQNSDYKVILGENECLEKGVFRQSQSGIFEVGFNQSGYLVLRRKGSSEVLWSLKASEEKVPSKICMANDGNLVIELLTGSQPICDTKSKGINERNFSFRFGINNSGGIAVFLDSENLLWTGGLGNDQPVEPTQVPIPPPTRAPTFVPTRVPTPLPTSRVATQDPTPSKNQDNNNVQYKKVLSHNDYFGKEKKNFGQSDSGEFEVGVNGNENLVVRRSGTSSDVVWVLKDSNGIDVIGDRLYLQRDGNLVMRTEDNSAVWTSKTAGTRTDYSFGINNCGGIAAFRTSNPIGLIWTGGIQENCGDSSPYQSPTLAPVSRPVVSPTLSPVVIPKPTPGSNQPTRKPQSVVLATNGRILERGQFVSSPNGEYNVGLNSNGNLIVREGNNKVWTLMDKNREEIKNISRMYMQSDGNLVLKTSSNKLLWNSETSRNLGAEFLIDDGGQLSINFKGASLWIDGLPRKTYTGPSSSDLDFPARGFFYYAWYPETWSVGGKQVEYRPNLGGIEGQYRSGDPVVVTNHVKALDYAWADISIVSWWGPSDRLDRARITQLLDETTAQGSSIKWTVYYEDEDDFDKTVDELVTDLDYLKKWFAWHESWAHKDGKPLIFIWNESECEVADRWGKAAEKAGWYVVLKLFGGYDECKTQPDSWHQYGVSDNYLEYPPSFTIGPGFYKANAGKPDHPRVPRAKFCDWVKEMNRSNRDWQLIVSFNEWGEGTAVESAVEWESESGYGIYLDCLRDPIAYGA